MAARILIVEDEEPLTLLLRYNLEAEGFEVDSVARGDDAELHLRDHTPDLVLLDWMLPGLSGIELCRRLRTRRDTERVPIIMLTARGEETERVRGLATGADDYVVKPFSLPELIAFQAARRPRHVALVLGDQRLDYAGLDAMSRRVASHLRRHGVAPGDRVGLLHDNSVEMVAAIWALLFFSPITGPKSIRKR